MKKDGEKKGRDGSFKLYMFAPIFASLPYWTHLEGRDEIKNISKCIN